MATAASPLSGAGGALLLVLPAFPASLIPALSGLMIYDRGAILNGEIWRLLSGHWVHFSFMHLLCDTLVLAGSSWILARRGCRWFPWACVLGAPLISLLLLWLEPGLGAFGGLSGLAMTGVLLFGLLELGQTGCRSGFGWGLVLLVAGRLLVDLSGTHFTLVGLGAQGVVPLPLSHGAGAVYALVLYPGLARQQRCNSAAAR